MQKHLQKYAPPGFVLNFKQNILLCFDTVTYLSISHCLSCSIALSISSSSTLEIPFLKQSKSLSPPSGLKSIACCKDLVFHFFAILILMSCCLAKLAMFIFKLLGNSKVAFPPNQINLILSNNY